ncbi:hypothetical protein PN836_018815 [Ningiella sp. W23]|uniref:hypothetical protein n=1 Tax=Ningiella sp. W23 TaxID=3023715 RepID=UPI003756D4DC
MIQKPEKPKNYIRDQFLIAFFVLNVILALFLWQAPHYLFVSIPLVLYFIVDGIWFKNYNAQKREYDEKVSANNAAKREAARVDGLYPKDSSVNENIANYLKQQREKKANKKWWQFWL